MEYVNNIPDKCYYCKFMREKENVCSCILDNRTLTQYEITTKRSDNCWAAKRVKECFIISSETEMGFDESASGYNDCLNELFEKGY